MEYWSGGVMGRGWRMEDEECRMENGEWRMENAESRIANREWRMQIDKRLA
jgi:hypothetical protein